MSQLNEVVQKLLEEARKLICNKQPARGPSTNDLRSKQEGVSTALKRVMEKAASTFPDAKVVISTLLPRQDFNPVLLQRVNASISRDCALKTNVFLAHHPTLEQHSLYDQVHIYRSEVPTFAKTLKDVALNRQPNTSHRTSRAMGIPPRPTSRGPPASRPPPRPRGPLTPKRPLPPRPHHHEPSTHTHTPWSYQPRPTPLLPTPRL